MGSRPPRLRRLCFPPGLCHAHERGRQRRAPAYPARPFSRASETKRTGERAPLSPTLPPPQLQGLPAEGGTVPATCPAGPQRNSGPGERPTPARSGSDALAAATRRRRRGERAPLPGWLPAAPHETAGKQKTGAERLPGRRRRGLGSSREVAELLSRERGCEGQQRVARRSPTGAVPVLPALVCCRPRRSKQPSRPTGLVPDCAALSLCLV